MIPDRDLATLKHWFLDEKRDLPWRNNPTPYAVWVSEVMLQQTQVAVVIPYFERWMKRFPSISDLAQASLDEVIKLWEGLGYYSRARNLHEGARHVMDHFSGEFPQEASDLKKIKGLGPYTIGAIQSFAFRKKAAAVDGNVMRVIARYFEIEDDLSKAPTIKIIWNLADQLLPSDEHWIINEALIELGATICNRTPQCASCPLKKSCLSYRNGRAHELPKKSSKGKTIPLFRAVSIITCDELILVRRAQKGEIMNDLHEFPYQETTPEGLEVIQQKNSIKKQWGLDVEYQNELPMVTHTFTKYRAKLMPRVFTARKAIEVEEYQWFSHQDLKQLAFSSGHRKIYKKLLNNF